MNHIAEDDRARSKFIYNFLHTQKNSRLSDNSIPKVIMQYWHSSMDIPDDVLKCIESWKNLNNHGFSFEFFNDESARNFIKTHFRKEYLNSYLKCHHPAMRCDYFRLCYLFVCGGAYIDSDELLLDVKFDSLFENSDVKIQSLCYSLEKGEMVDIKDYLNCPYDETNIYYFNNNPIISPPRHPLIAMALERATDKLINEVNLFDIQSTTGPGNLSASLVYYLLKGGSDIEYIKDWNSISKSDWSLKYRHDDRNWRLYKGTEKKWFEN